MHGFPIAILRTIPAQKSISLVIDVRLLFRFVMNRSCGSPFEAIIQSDTKGSSDRFMIRCGKVFNRFVEKGLYRWLKLISGFEQYSIGE